MTGPEHYREAERLVSTAAGLNGERPALAAEYLAAAQAHATLALAAATAVVPFVSDEDGTLIDEWLSVAGPAEG